MPFAPSSPSHPQDIQRQEQQEQQQQQLQPSTQATPAGAATTITPASASSDRALAAYSALWDALLAAGFGPQHVRRVVLELPPDKVRQGDGCQAQMRCTSPCVHCAQHPHMQRSYDVSCGLHF